MFLLVQPNGSYFGWIYSFNRSSNWLRTLKLMEWFRKNVGLWYQDGSNMAEHINAFQGLTKCWARKLNLGMGWKSRWPNWLGPDRLEEVGRLIGRRPICEAGSVWSGRLLDKYSAREYIWELVLELIDEHWSTCRYFYQFFMDLNKSALSAHSMYRAYCIIWIKFLCYALFVSPSYSVFKLFNKPSFFVYCYPAEPVVSV